MNIYFRMNTKNYFPESILDEFLFPIMFQLLMLILSCILCKINYATHNYVLSDLS